MFSGVVFCSLAHSLICPCRRSGGRYGGREVDLPELRERQLVAPLPLQHAQVQRAQATRGAHGRSRRRSGSGRWAGTAVWRWWSRWWWRRLWRRCTPVARRARRRRAVVRLWIWRCRRVRIRGAYAIWRSRRRGTIRRKRRQRRDGIRVFKLWRGSVRQRRCAVR